MKKNIGVTDRVIRVVIGVILLSLIFWGPRTWFGLIGLIPILTVFMGYCPLYPLLGINTCKNSLPEAEPTKTELKIETTETEESK